MSQDVRQGKGFGYVDKEGKTCMIRCFECGEENYGMVVASGYCFNCSYTPNEQGESNAQDEVKTEA